MYIYPKLSEDFSIYVDKNQGSPITNIEGFFEKNNVQATPLNVESYGEFVSSDNQILNLYMDISNNNGGFREFTFKITKICDEAKNCLSNSIINYNILGINIPNVSYSGGIKKGLYYASIKGNFNGILLKVLDHNKTYIYAIPSIINTGNESKIEDFVYSSYASIPYSYKEKIYHTGSINYNPSTFKIYEKDIGLNYNETDLLNILVKIREIYNNTPFVLNDDFKLVLKSNDTIEILKKLSLEINGDINYEKTGMPLIY